MPVRPREWPRLVQQLGAWPAIQQALLLQDTACVPLEEAAQRAGVHIDTVPGWQRATSRNSRSTDGAGPIETPVAQAAVRPAR